MSLPNATGRAVAETTLTSTATITSAGATTLNTTTGAMTPTRVAVWSGPCSLGPSQTSDRTDSGGDDRIIGYRVLRLAIDDDIDDIAVGHHVTVEDADGVADPTTYVVREIQRRTTEVLRRVRVVSLADSQRVPL